MAGLAVLPMIPRVGAEVLSQWVDQLPNLQWIVGQRPRSVGQKGDRLTSVTFEDMKLRPALFWTARSWEMC